MSKLKLSETWENMEVLVVQSSVRENEQSNMGILQNVGNEVQGDTLSRWEKILCLKELRLWR